MASFFSRGCGWGLCAGALVLAAAFALFTSAAYAEDHPVYGPRFEIGGGLGYSSENLPPQWASKNNRVCLLIGNIRLFKGLAVQGGVDWSNGGKPQADSITCGGYRVKINKGTFSGAKWAGLRYEVPMSLLRRDIAGIHSVYGAAGYSWSEMGVQSTEWVYKGVTETTDRERGFRLADMNGPYAILAARWRIDSPETEGRRASWLGAYGLDVGVRYNRYREMDGAYPNIPKASSNYGSYQVFMVGFLKFRMFE